MLKEIRESRGMSQQDLADKSGITKRMIQAYEQGYREINGAKLSKLVTLCLVLECHLSEIVDDEQLVKDLKAYEDAEEAGLLIRLPCKVGDAVYTVDLDCRDNPDQSKMCFCWNKSCKECDKSYLRVWENRNKTSDIRSIVAEMGLCGESGGFGKTVFLTRAEAEEALKGGTS